MNISLKIYALLLSLAILIFSVFFGGYIFHQIESAQNTLSDWKQTMAENELDKAIKKAGNFAQQTTEDFASWDEVRQQLLSPAFYPYWRDQRMMSAHHLPKDTISANLYDVKGESLLSITTLDFPMQLNPANIPKPYILNKHGNEPQLFYFAPVNSTGKKSIIGFVSVSLPLIPLIVNHPYQHLEAKSIEIDSIESNILLENTVKYIKYTLEEDISSETVQSILNNAGTTILVASLVIALFLYVLLNYGVHKPLQLLIEHIHSLRRNPDLLHSGQFIKKLPISELNEVGDALNAYQDELNIVYGNLDEKNKELHSLAYIDPLTGMKNRRSFNDHWEKIVSIAKSSRMEISMILFDVNHFKAINDSYGHNVGDDVLITISSLISQELRKGDYLYRLGGDEFGTAIINCDENTAYDISNRCFNRLKEYDFKSLGVMENIRISIGIACANTTSLSELDNLGWQADTAVYMAKQPSNDNVMIYQHGEDDSSRSLFSNYIYSAIFDAIEKGIGLTIFYQPIVNLDNGYASYYESLVRIKLNNEIISPNQIFPIIANRNLDIDMDKAIVSAIIDDLESMKVPKETGISINLSGPSVGSKELISWVEPLTRFLKDYKIVFEVTETSLISQMSRATENLNKLKTKGFKIALDDFGSGYSSLRYLGSMPVDIVKFDISLINELNNEKKRTLIFNLCNMIREIGYDMVAEGIEEVDTHKQIILAGFNYGQGYLYGKPAEENLNTCYLTTNDNSQI
jgi:diguanylate cyclase (GGDEF)-like protein